MSFNIASGLQEIYMQHEIWEMINVIMHIKMTVFRNRSRTKRNQISEYEMTSTNSCHVQWSLTSFKAYLHLCFQCWIYSRMFVINWIAQIFHQKLDYIHLHHFKIRIHLLEYQKINADKKEVVLFSGCISQKDCWKFIV